MMPHSPPVARAGPSDLAGAVASGSAAAFAAMLDEVDHAMVLVDTDRVVLHANRLARWQMARQPHRSYPLEVVDGLLRATDDADAAALREALLDAGLRQRRSLLGLGRGPERACMALIPLPQDGGAAAPRVLLACGKVRMAGELAIHWFGRAHGLTAAERQVVEALCAGLHPQEIAQRLRVSISTIRTQLGAVRAKTGARSLRDLIHQVACMPPLVPAL